MKSIAVLTGVATIVAWFAIHALPPGEAHAATARAVNYQVESISFDGKGLPLAQLRDAITTRIGSTVDPEQLASDRAALQAWLENRGYLAATVESAVVTFGATGGAYVVFDIHAGPLFHIRSVVLEGDAWSDAGIVTIRPGDEASGERIARARQTAEDTLARHGSTLDVDLVVRTFPDEAELDVTLVAR